MKNFKSILKTLLFSAFMTVVVSTTGNAMNVNTNLEEGSVSVCSEEYPDIGCNESGY